jgi:ABC-2 type transport system permease protein
MNLHRVWTLARKDLYEIRSSKYLLYSVIGFPIILALTLPFIAVGTLSVLPAYSGPLPLHLTITQNYSNAALSRVVLVNASVETSTVHVGAISASFIGNSTLTNVLILGSFLYHDTLINCSVMGSNLDSVVTLGSTTVSGSVVVGELSPQAQAFVQLSRLFEFFLVLTPVVVPTVMASYTIVGEKTGRSLEPLLATPLSDRELLVGKAFAILVASILSSWFAFLLFQIVFTYELATVVHLAFSPGASWYLLMFFVAPALCLLSIGVNLIVSTRVSDVRASQQIGSLVLLPVTLIVLLGAFGALALDTLQVAGLGALFYAVDAVVLLVAARVFDREEILARWK